MALSFQYTLLIFTLLHHLALSAPMNQRRVPLSIPLRKRSTDIKPLDLLSFLREDLEYTIAKYSRGFQIYHSNTGMRHPLDKEIYKSFGLGRRSPSSVRLTQDTGKTLWQGAVNVGTPSRQFIVDFDTGSTDMFLPGAACTENCQGHRLYDPGASYTSRDYEQTFSMTYVDNSSVQGEVYVDKVIVDELTAFDQVFGVASTYTESLSAEVFSPDGLVGLAYQSLSQFPSPPFIQQLFAEGRIPEPVFGFDFEDDHGQLHIGNSQARMYGPRLVFTPVTEQGFWQITLDAISIFSTIVVQSQAAAIDTGTSNIVAPTDVADQLYAAIPSSRKLGNGFYTLPCSSMPTISLTFAGQPFAVSPALFNLGPVDDSTDQCFGGVAATDALDFWIIGDMFLQGVYTEFDFGLNRVGFAQAM